MLLPSCNSACTSQPNFMSIDQLFYLMYADNKSTHQYSFFITVEITKTLQVHNFIPRNFTFRHDLNGTASQVAKTNCRIATGLKTTWFTHQYSYWLYYHINIYIHLRLNYSLRFQARQILYSIHFHPMFVPFQM